MHERTVLKCIRKFENKFDRVKIKINESKMDQVGGDNSEYMKRYGVKAKIRWK